MHFLILSLAFLMWTGVSAEQKYTDYEFQGYTEEKLVPDELHRYESVTFNRFYDVIEKDAIYLDSLEKNGYDCVDENDFIKEEYLRESPLINYKNEEKIVIYGPDKFKIDHFYLEGENFFDVVGDLKIFSNDTKIDFDFETVDEKIKINLKDSYEFTDIAMSLKYRTNEPYVFYYLVYYPVYDEYFRFPIDLNNELDHTFIYTLESSDFQKFIRANHFTFYEVLHYYECQRTRYKHYNLKKEYYMDSEADSIEGYVFDPEESYVLYKIYTRERIEDPEIKQDENIKEDSIPSGDKVPEIQEKPTVIKENITNVYNYTSLKDSDTEDRKDEETKDQLITCNCNCEPEKVSDHTSSETSVCKESNRSKILMYIGEVLLIIALLEFVLYGFNVNRNNKNG